MSQTSDYLEAAQLNEAYGGTALAAAANIDIALCTAAVTDSDTGLTISEPPGANGYARQTLTNNATNFPAAAANGNAQRKSNGVAITFGPVTNADWAQALDLAFLEGGSNNILHSSPLVEAYKAAYVAALDDVVHSVAHGYSDNDQVRIFQLFNETLPVGLTHSSQIYHIISATTNTFQVSLTQGGGAVDITALGALMVAKSRAVTATVGGDVTIPIGNININSF